MNKVTKKIIKKLLIVMPLVILIFIIALILNNRIVSVKYGKLDTSAEFLSKEDIQRVDQVYDYLNKYGSDILPGFNGKDIDLIIFNDSFEFLISSVEEEYNWEFVESNSELGLNIFRRPSQNPQAFTVYINNRWVGSMSTMDTFNKSITKEVGILFPPQLIILDAEHYKGIVIHEMVHAYQAKNNEARVKKLEKLHNVCSEYYNDSKFNNLLVLEGNYLQKAINASTKKDIIENLNLYLKTRQQRRTECMMNTDEINDEIDMEWLEGLAKYAEYKASTASDSFVRNNMDKIDQNVKVLNDDRYYSLGMAQALILDKLQPEWKREVYDKNFQFEEKLKEVLKTSFKNY